MSNERRIDQPDDHATELASVALKAFNAEADQRGLADARCIVLVVLPTDGKNDGGIAIGGYGNDEDTGPKAVTDLIFHTRAVLRTMGKDLDVITVPGDAQA